jgi:outer membrane immunogenic protein
MKRLVWGIAGLVVMASAAIAADMPVKAIHQAPIVYGWTGWYAGVSAGYGWRAESAVVFTPNDPLIALVTCGGGTCAVPTSNKLSGVFGGAQFGYNWQVNPTWVLGFETDLSAGRIRGSGTGGDFQLALVTGHFEAQQEVKWFGTVRGRAGFLATDSLLIYGTAGLAYGRVSEATNLIAINQVGAVGLGFAYGCFANSGAFPVCFAGESARWRAGWTVGAGLEWAVAKNISLKAEYLHVNLGSGDTVVVTAASNAGTGATPASFLSNYGRPDFDMVRFGVNYHFNEGPVIARY